MYPHCRNNQTHGWVAGSLQMLQTLLSCRTKGQMFSCALFWTPRSLVGTWFHGHISCLLNSTQCFRAFRLQAQMSPKPSKVAASNNHCCECLALTHRQTDIKRTSAITHINSGQETQFLLLFYCGIGVATPTIRQAARTGKFIAVKGEVACKTSDGCWKRSNMPSWSWRDGFWLLRISMQNGRKKKTKFAHRVFCENLHFWALRSQTSRIFKAKNDVWHWMHRTATELPQYSATHKTCKINQISQRLCPMKAFLSKCAHICEFLPGNGCSKTMAPKMANEGFGGRWQASLRAQFPKIIGEVWHWFDMGIRWR